MSVAVSAEIAAAASAATPPYLLHCTRPSSVPLTCGNYSSVGLIFLSSSEHAHAGVKSGQEEVISITNFLIQTTCCQEIDCLLCLFCSCGQSQSVEYYLSSSRSNPLCFGGRKLVVKVLLICYPACFLLDMGTNNASDIIVLLYNSEGHRMLI